MKKKDQCYEVRELLSLYLDNELTDVETNMVNEHLALCPECKKEYLEMLEIGEILRRIPDVEIPNQFDLRLKRALAEEGKSIRKQVQIIGNGKNKKNNWRMLSSLVAVFAVGLISFFAFGHIQIVPNHLDGSQQSGAKYSREQSGVQYAGKEATQDDKELNTLKKSMPKEKAGQTEELPKPKDLIKSSGSENYDAGVGNEKFIAPMVQMSPMTIEGDNGYAPYDEVSAAPESDASLRSMDLASGASFKLMNPASTSTSDHVSDGNEAERKLYEGLIAEKLKNYNYEITDSSYKNNSEWHFVVFIFDGKDGKIIEKEIEVVGKGREIEVLYADEFMGL